MKILVGLGDGIGRMVGTGCGFRVTSCELNEGGMRLWWNGLEGQYEGRSR